MVDGVFASCYPSVDHSLAHFGMIPLRWFPEIMEFMFAEDSGIQVSVSIAEQLGNWLLPIEQLKQY